MLKRLTAILLVIMLVVSCAAIGEAASYKRLKKGSRGAAVKTLQTELKNQGYYSGKIDGIYGKGTVSAVKAFQKKNGLKTDGIAGPLTQAKLYQKKTQTASAAKAETTPAAGTGTARAPAVTSPSVPDQALSFLQGIQKSSGAACGTVVL
jgi:peptidoglycan hydrolase-like protein with peptidoglycan-binding domain